MTFRREDDYPVVTRHWFYSPKPNANGETMTIEINAVSHDLKNKRSLMNLWVKEGWLKAPIETFWSVTTYVEDAKGNCRGAYNPQHYDYKKRDGKGRVVFSNMRIEFAWILPATEENLTKVVEECERMFYNMIPTKKVREVA